jgi:hypothetical protein
MDGVARLECRRVDEFCRVEKLTLAQRGQADPVVATQPHPSFASLIVSRRPSRRRFARRSHPGAAKSGCGIWRPADGPVARSHFLAGAEPRTNASAAKILDRLEPVRHAVDSRQAGKSSEQAGLI